MARDLHAIADRVEREARAREVLAEGFPTIRTTLVSTAWLGLSYFALDAMAIPTVAQVWLLLGLSTVPAGIFETTYVRRRLQAALVLLDLSQGER